MKRVFLAVNLQDTTLLELYINEIRSKLQAENIHWIEAKNAHLTLKFFGPTDDKTIEKIHLSLQKAFKNQKSFDIALSKLGVFGSKYQPRVLWMVLDDSSKMIELAQHINQHLAQIGIEADRQNFVPHISLARIKKLSSKKYFQSVIDAHQLFHIGANRIDKVYLYQSILSSQGPIYKVLKTYKLKD